MQQKHPANLFILFLTETGKLSTKLKRKKKKSKRNFIIFSYFFITKSLTKHSSKFYSGKKIQNLEKYRMQHDSRKEWHLLVQESQEINMQVRD